MGRRDVLEIGLGDGTVAQRIAAASARYRGLDVAQGPVDMVNHRLAVAGLPGEARQGSILAAPFADESFDFVVTIGCLHHTGDLQRGIDECFRLLRPARRLIAVVYNAYSCRRWLQAAWPTLRYFAAELAGHRGVVAARSAAERGAYDADQSGAAAPHTDFVSVRSLRHACRCFRSFAARRENVDRRLLLPRPTREQLLASPVPRLCGHLHERAEMAGCYCAVLAASTRMVIGRKNSCKMGFS